MTTRQTESLYGYIRGDDREHLERTLDDIVNMFSNFGLDDCLCSDCWDMLNDIIEREDKVNDLIADKTFIANKIFFKPKKNNNIQTVQIEFIKGNKIGDYHDIVIRMKAINDNGNIVYEVSESLYDTSQKTHLCNFSVCENVIESPNELIIKVNEPKTDLGRVYEELLGDGCLCLVADDINRFIIMSFEGGEVLD